jgi:hypothetical protein
MSVLLQQLVVGVLVAACALYSAWRLATVALRLRALDALAALPGVRRMSWLATLRQRTLARQLSACGGCASKPGAVSRNRTPGALRR